MSWWDQMSSAFVTFSSVFQKNLSITQASSFTTSTRSWDNRLFQQLSPYYFFRLNQEELDETTTILFFKGPINTGYATKNCLIFSLNQLDTLRGAGTRGVEKSCEGFRRFHWKIKAPQNQFPKIPTDVNFTVVAAKTVYGERRFFAIFQAPLFSSSFFTILVTFHVAVWHCGWAWVGQMHRQLNTYISRNLSLTYPHIPPQRAQNKCLKPEANQNFLA